jgi:hypothetical protein
MFTKYLITFFIYSIIRYLQQLFYSTENSILMKYNFDFAIRVIPSIGLLLSGETMMN